MSCAGQLPFAPMLFAAGLVKACTSCPVQDAKPGRLQWAGTGEEGPRKESWSTHHRQHVLVRQVAEHLERVVVLGVLLAVADDVDAVAEVADHEEDVEAALLLHPVQSAKPGRLQQRQRRAERPRNARWTTRARTFGMIAQTRAFSSSEVWISAPITRPSLSKAICTARRPNAAQRRPAQRGARTRGVVTRAGGGGLGGLGGGRVGDRRGGVSGTGYQIEAAAARRRRRAESRE